MRFPRNARHRVGRMDDTHARTMKNDATRSLMTGEELAAHLKISKRTLATWRDLGRVPCVRFSARCFRYDPAAVERALVKTP